MNENIFRGFADEMAKVAKEDWKKETKKSLPWAIARGLTGAGAGAIYGMPMAKVMGLKGRALAKFLAATAGTGLGVSFTKGLSEKAIEGVASKALGVKKK